MTILPLAILCAVVLGLLSIEFIYKGAVMLVKKKIFLVSIHQFVYLLVRILKGPKEEDKRRQLFLRKYGKHYAIFILLGGIYGLLDSVAIFALSFQK